MLRTAGCVGLTALAVLLGGCGEKIISNRAEVPLEGVDQKKIRLLDEINRKYENPEAHYQLGKVYQSNGMWNKAEFEFNVAIQFSPMHRRAQAGLIRTLLDSGQKDKARLTAEIYLNQAVATAEGALRLGKALQDEGLNDYALEAYQQALQIAPNSAALNKQIGYYYLRKNEKIRAEEYLRRSFALDPYQPDVAGELGRMGIVVEIPRRTERNTKKLDRMLNAEATTQATDG